LQQYLDQIMTHEHKEIGIAALRSYVWLVRRITEETPDGGLVAGGRPVKLDEIARDLGLEVKAVQRHIAILKAGRCVRARKGSHGVVYEVVRLRPGPNAPGPLQTNHVNSTEQQLCGATKSGYPNTTTSLHDDTTPPPARGSHPDGLSLSPVPPISTPLPSSPSSPGPTKLESAPESRPNGELFDHRHWWAIATSWGTKHQGRQVVLAFKACRPESLVGGVLTVRLPADPQQVALVRGAEKRAANGLRMDKRNQIELRLIPDDEHRAGP
jgi:hypothetical protein